MAYIHHDRNNEQMLIPITLVRGGTSRGFYMGKTTDGAARASSPSIDVAGLP